MAVTFRNNCQILGFGADYYKIRDFLITLDYPTFHFGRWDWMVTHGYLDKSGIPKIAVWEDDGWIVALTTYDTTQGEGFFCVYDEYAHLKKEMARYAFENFRRDGVCHLVAEDNDVYFQNVLSDMGFIATESKEWTAVFPIGTEAVDYKLPEGFRITSLADTYDVFQCGQVMWRGFNHEADGEGPFNPSPGDLADAECQLKRPNVNLNLKIAAVAPNGDFASFCGMWCDPASPSALVEPVATDPKYRKMGLGKAVVLEAVKRCGRLGAKRAFVGSAQQFYYSIGFRPYATATRWRKKNWER
jgi:ribosomal protein S18 acetylase RimI-like enzyme